MLKRFLLAVLWLPLIALAQSYPSPTYQNVTVLGTLTAATPAFTNPLPVSSGGTNCAAASGSCLDNITGFSSTGFLTRTGSGAYAFQSLTNGITYGNLAQAGANTLLGNATGSTANVSAVTVTGCNGAAQALQWTNGAGFGCNSSVATSGANANITSLSGLTTALSVSQGGTGRSTLTTHGVLVGEGTSAINQLFVGTTGQVLVGSTGADPAFGTTVAGLTFTGAITPQSTGGIVGTTTNDNANAGSVGEILTATSTATSLSTGVANNCASISLTAGDWDVTGVVEYVPAGSTTTAGYTTGLNTTSATYQTLTGSFLNVQQTFGLSVAGGTASYQAAPTTRFTLSGTTTVFLVGAASFSVSTMTCNGFIRARRMR